MIEMFLYVFAAMLIAVVFLALGVIFQNKPLKGSCGGAAQLASLHGEEVVCDVCGAKPGDACLNEDD